MRARARNGAVVVAWLAASVSCESAPTRPATSSPRVERLESSKRKQETSARPSVPVEVPKADPKSIPALAIALQGAPIAATTNDLPQVTTMALVATARAEARGLDPLGEVMHARLEEGRYAQIDLTLRPGDCVTGIAHGGLGVAEVDAFLVLAMRGPLGGAPVPDPAPVPAGSATATVGPASSAAAAKPIDAPGVRVPVLAQDARGGPIAVVGGAAGCYPYTGNRPTPGRFVVVARKGAGEVVFAAYRTVEGSNAPDPAGSARPAATYSIVTNATSSPSASAPPSTSATATPTARPTAAPAVTASAGPAKPR